MNLPTEHLLTVIPAIVVIIKWEDHGPGQPMKKGKQNKNGKEI
jgi:hypothetical protein